MSGPNGAAARLLALMRTLGDCTSVELLAAMGRPSSDVSVLCTQLRYLERTRRVRRVGKRLPTGMGRAAIVFRVVGASEPPPIPKPERPVLERAKPDYTPPPKPKRTPAQEAMKQQNFVQSTAKPAPIPKGAQTVAEFLARGGRIEVLPGPEPMPFVTVPAFPRCA